MLSPSRTLIVGFIAASAVAISACSSDTDTDTSEDVPVALTTGTSTIQITETLTYGGKTYSCPLSTSDRLDPLRVPTAEQQARIHSVRRQEKKLERRIKRMDKQYPGNSAPTQAIADEYNALLRSLKKLNARDNRAVDKFNALADEHNRILEDDCTRE